jgi:hypothetical protein
MTFAPSGAILSTIAAVIDAERRCCRFLQFDLSVMPDAGPVALSISGPGGTVEFSGDAHQPVIGNLIWFAIAAVLEIGGCFAF